MNQSQFESRYSSLWKSFEEKVANLESKGSSNKINRNATDVGGFARDFRQLCNHYGLAKARHYSPALVDTLHDLVLRGHRQLYKKNKGSLLWRSLRFLASDFPVAVRECYRTFWLAFCLFYIPAIVLGYAVYREPSLIYSVMDSSRIAQLEEMYDPASGGLSKGGPDGSRNDFTMFGFYIYNNISIGFRTFASGLVFGIGAVFLLVFNGLMIGAVSGYLTHPPFREIFWQFVCGHGPFELTAIVICGTAGLLLGYSILKPGRYRRLDSLKLVAPQALKLVMGGAIMLVVAAIIEAFWSSSNLSLQTKLLFALANWTFVVLYLLFGGRRFR